MAYVERSIQTNKNETQWVLAFQVEDEYADLVVEMLNLYRGRLVFGGPPSFRISLRPGLPVFKLSNLGSIDEWLKQNEI